MKYSIIILSAIIVSLSGCKKEPLPLNFGGQPRGGMQPDFKFPASGSILIDASKDGGGWWYPQSSATGFSADGAHQGKALADWLKSLGFKVDELPRGAIITSELLAKYSKVIRATAFFNYSADEILAYQSFLDRSSSLLLITDHLQNTFNDQLSASLGLMFEGSYGGPITSIQPHPTTIGVGTIDFIAGSVLRTWDASKITPLGYVSSVTGTNGSAAAAMGLVAHPTSKIFFIGDVNGIEQVPQPFTSNLMKWLFQ